MIADLSRVLAVVGLVWGCLVPLQAQTQTYEPGLLTKGSIKRDKIQLPREAQNKGPIKELAEDWYAYEVKFNTTAPLTEELTIKFYTDMVDTLAKGKENAESTVILTAETTYINVPAGTGHVAVVYLHPTSVLRYGGTRGQEGIKKANVRVELLEGGKKVDEIDLKEEKTDWVEALTKSGVVTVSGVLLSPENSPFWITDTQKINQIKRPTR
jgi:hypothetical protein